MSTIRTRDLPDPDGSRFGIPTFYWGTAPEGLATRRQLRARGLQPNRRPYVAQAVRPRRNREPLTAHLYRVEDAAPKRPPSEAQLASVERATRAHQEHAMRRHGIDPAEEQEDEVEVIELEEW